MKTKPIIPWDAKEFFSNPGKYEPIYKSGNVGNGLPALQLDGSLINPHLWQGMREKTVIIEHIKYANIYRGSLTGSCYAGPLHDTEQEAKARNNGRNVATVAITWKEEQ